MPVLVQAYPDDLDQAAASQRRRDAFCGKISVCNNLRQYGIPFTPDRAAHRPPVVGRVPATSSLTFLGVCRVVRGLRRARIGAIGARPNAFNTTRYSEKLLEATGISVSTLDLSEVLDERARGSTTTTRGCKQKLAEIGGYAAGAGRAERVAGADGQVRRRSCSEWMTRLDLDATAIQCWSSLQQNYGVNCCTIMSMMSEKLMPSACEVDVAGTVAMYALQLASGKPSALVDWNNNYGDDPNKCVFFHCGNWAKAFLPGHRRSPRRRSSAPRSARRTPTARWPAARRAAPSRSAASRPTTGTAGSRPTSAKAGSPTIR